MMSIMISIKPQWVEKILNKEKTIEIRKATPKCELPCKVYIYCTKAKLPKQDFDCVRADHLTKPHPITKKYILGANYDECLNGKVVAEFTLNKVDEFHIPCEAKFLYDALNSKNENILKQSCLNIDEMFKYLKDKYYGYAWHIDNLKIYDKPKELSEFTTSPYCSNYIKNVEVTVNALGDYVAHYEDNFICRKCKYFDGDFNICEKKESVLKRPPQSWCYVED